MAITHFTPRIVSRGKGRSVVAAAAYRHCSKMLNQREGRTTDYSRKPGLAHEEFVLPPGAPMWLRTLVADRSVAGASEAFWNALERFERRSDAQLARELLFALPNELTLEQNVELVRAFVTSEMLPRGFLADWVLHHPPGNPHVHLLTNLRPLTPSGFGDKKVALRNEDGTHRRDEGGRLLYRLWAGDREDFLSLRQAWLDLINRHLLQHGHDVKVDGRSYAERGVALEATVHLGPTAKAMASRDQLKRIDLDRMQLAMRQRGRLASMVRAKPGIIIAALSQEHSVFDHRDVARWLHRYFDPDQSGFQTIMAAVLNHPEIVCLQRQSVNDDTGLTEPARYSTRAMIALEAHMASQAGVLSRRNGFACAPKLTSVILQAYPKLSREQGAAIGHVCENRAIAAVVGRAGAGKTTMMAAARQIWEASGYVVVGGALAGKAAESLQTDAAIDSRTLASWELAWNKNRDRLDQHTVFVLDEAGMVSSGQMASLLNHIAEAGAKLVLIGDPDQLQPIAAGAAFRSLIAEIGFAELQTIYRQQTRWMQTASIALAQGRIGEAITAYADHGMVRASRTRAGAIQVLIADWIAAYDPGHSQLILAHRRADVATLNQLARLALQSRGLVDEGHKFLTELGPRRFAKGDQVVFLRNDRAMGVKNGMLGKVLSSAPGTLTIAIGAGVGGREVVVHQHLYRDLDHGYATTIHKSQGATVDQVRVLATSGFDRHLTYVAMTRHRTALFVYHGSAEFRRAGGVVAALGRPNTKLTTRDFVDSSDYQAAWRYATSRGLHAVRVASTLLATQRQWLTDQRQRLAGLASRLARLILPPAVAEAQKGPDRPLFAAVEQFDQSIAQFVARQIVEDPALERARQSLVDRFEMVFANGRGVFQRLELMRCVHDPVWRSHVQRQLEKPDTLASLAGRSGLFAASNAKQRRQLAFAGLAALRGEVDMFIKIAAAASQRYHAAELLRRQALACEVPQPSAAAVSVLQTWLSSTGLAPTSAPQVSPAIHQEIVGLAQALSNRFGTIDLSGTSATSTELLGRVLPHEQATLVGMLPLLNAARRMAQRLRSPALSPAPTLSQRGLRQ